MLVRSLLIAAYMVTQYSSCAPSNAKALREQKSLTLGVPGISKRLNGAMDIGVNINPLAAVSWEFQKTKDEEALTYGKNFTDDATHRAVEVKFGISPHVFARFYPWDASAFFFGVGFGQEEDSVQFKALESGKLSLDDGYADVKVTEKKSSINIPIGWQWIWDSGFTFGLSFGPKYIFNKQTVTSANKEYDQSDYDWIVETSEDEERFSFSGSLSTGVIGYSF